MHEPRSAIGNNRSGLITMALIAVTAIATTACGSNQRRAEDAHLRPISTHETTAEPAPPPSLPAPSTIVIDGSTDHASPTGRNSRGHAASKIVEGALARYDKIVTDLAADPAAASNPESPPRLALDALIPAESSLHSGVLEQLVYRPLSEATKLLPGPQGVSYRHHVESASAFDNSVEFTWCGYAPGVRVSVTDGSVVDDKVASLRGIGRLVNEDDKWRLDSLDQLDLSVMPAGSTDPCHIGDDK